MSAGWRSNGGGLVIEIDHGKGLHTLYNHLGVILVAPGQVVARGQRIEEPAVEVEEVPPHEGHPHFTPLGERRHPEEGAQA